MKLLTHYHCLVLMHFVASIICENFSYYSILAPGLIKSNRKYTVALTLHESSSPCTIQITIWGSEFNASNEVVLQPFQTKTLEFFPPKLGSFDYKLLAEGRNGCDFRNESELLNDPRSGPKIYIQTDKARYKPLDVVQFRIAVLDEHTRPADIQEPIRVEILDYAQNRVKTFKDIKLIQGVYKNKFNLSQQPVMGTWTIQVFISGKYSIDVPKYFEVVKYTLPKFSVNMDVSKNFLIDNPIIQAEIYGKYTFNKYVKGTLYIELRNLETNELIKQQAQEIDGVYVVELRVENAQRLAEVKLLKLLAVIEEKNTGIHQNISETIHVRKTRYNIFISIDEIEFRNSKPFRLRAYVSDWIDGPVRDSHTPIILEHGSRTYRTYLNDEGVAMFEFEYVRDSPYTVAYKDSKSNLPSFELYAENDEVFYCKLDLKERPSLRRPVEVEVRSSYNLPYLVYIVVGHGSIIQQEFVQLSGNKKTYTIKLTPSIEMIPVSFLYVHYILDGHFRHEEFQLNFPQELENQISVEAPKQVKPGQNVTIKIKAVPKSYVSLLAVDISVFFIDSSYDIYKEYILEDLNLDRTEITDGNIVRPGVISGVLTLTNAHYHIKSTEYYPTSSGNANTANYRTKFPETWIFEDYFINDTETEIALNIPETITTWRITAFSNHAVKGFGITDGPTDVTTFLPFFVSLNLPYEVKRGEVVAIPITAFNYHNQTLNTDITLQNNYTQFQFMEPLTKSSGGYYKTKNIVIPADGGETVKFLIKPIVTGQLKLYIAANNSMFSDGILHYLNVVSEGIPNYENIAGYLSAEDAKSTFALNLPKNSVNNSELITLMVGGDFMMPALDNFKQMVRLPTGCGEQNMVNFAPNILILDYLKATGKLSTEKDLVKEATLYTEIGYQQELSFRHDNGGYSVFGENHTPEASSWLTAYVTRFFIKALRYASIESRIINSGLEYLSQQQLNNGSFPYTGYLFYKELQNEYGFTAYVLLTFLESRKYSRKYSTLINKGLEFITSNLNNISDVYDLSLAAAALSKAKHAAADTVLKKLHTYRKEDETGLMWWSSVTVNDVETTSYILLALLDVYGNHLPILKWLIEQRNSKGGFKSTHDTVVGLEALVKYAEKNKNASNWDMQISYTAQDDKGNLAESSQFLVNKSNAFVLQQHELPSSVRRINFEVTGTGRSLVQLSSQCNVRSDLELKYFVMETNPTVRNSEELDLEICFTYHAINGANNNNNNTNMVIMEAHLPSGFLSPSDVSGLLKEDLIQRAETKNKETTVVLYFDKLAAEVQHCVNIEAYLAHEVNERKPAAIKMYDYYDTTRFNTLFYTIDI